MKKKQAQRRNKWAAETRALLVEKFPKCFAPKGEDKRPLKIGIYHDIRAALPELPAMKLHPALYDYTSGATYLRNLIEAGAPRFDLNGEPSGIVTEMEAHFARLYLDGHGKLAPLHREILRLETALAAHEALHDAA